MHMPPLARGLTPLCLLASSALAADPALAPPSPHSAGDPPTQVAREIKLHVELAHDSIIAMYAAWKDRSYVYLALEWAPGVSGCRLGGGRRCAAVSVTGAGHVLRTRAGSVRHCHFCTHAASRPALTLPCPLR